MIALSARSACRLLQQNRPKADITRATAARDDTFATGFYGQCGF
jgi:hypothetical protein